MRHNAISYYADFFICIAIVLALCAMNVVSATESGSLVQVPIWFASALAGLVVWTFAEYAIHRFMSHRVPPFDRLHDAHHAEPEALIGAPPIIGILLILGVGSLPLLVFHVPVASGFTSGLLIGYVAYMLVHHAAHHWKAGQGTWLFELRRHHALHHFRSDEGNFGIITSFWDRLFGTAFEPARRSRERSTA